jgi:Ni/Fe-hydrogenase subunit HybB-like protein
MRPFLLGALTIACAVAALFFLRYRKIARDRFFMYFAIAFAVMAVTCATMRSMISSGAEAAEDAPSVRNASRWTRFSAEHAITIFRPEDTAASMRA